LKTTLFTSAVASILVGLTVALAEDAPGRPQGGLERPGRRDPHIVSPRAMNQNPPNAPALPYHFVTPPITW
jgi:hypothetical protein